MGLGDRIFSGGSAQQYAPNQALQKRQGQAFQLGHDVAAIKTYRYLRLAMLAAVAALAYSILEERFAQGVNCFVGSISGYYYSPVHPIFVGVMISIGLALLVIKGRTVIEDACLSFAGVLAPIVALVPTTYDPSDKCAATMAVAGHYLPPAKDSRVAANSIGNGLHAYLVAGTVAIALVLVAALAQLLRSRRNTGTTTLEYTKGTLWTLGAAVVFVGIAWAVVELDYKWVLQGHAWCAIGMFALLAAAALSNGILGIRKHYTKRGYSVSYIIVGSLMVLSGILFLAGRSSDQSTFGGHLVLYVEIAELVLFTAFWAMQTVERWHDTV